MSVIMHDATCKGAINYLNLAREIIAKNGLVKDALAASTEKA
jgi:chromosome partitioning protein